MNIIPSIYKYNRPGLISGGFISSGLDPDAAAFIADVEAALSSSILGFQKTAIDTFIKAGKSDGWWSSIKRLYLPIWADPAANAIDMITRTSGTFPVAGGVTHDAGYVQGNGTTGYFNIGASPAGLGMTTGTGHLSVLVYVADPTTAVFDCFIGAANAGNVGLTEIRDTNADIVSGFIGFGTGVSDAPSTGRNGLYVMNRSSSTSAKCHRRTTSAFATGTTITVAPTAVTTSNLYALGRNADGSLVFPTDARIGAFGAGLGFASDATVAAYTLALKDLWEDCTLLTLP